MTTHTSGPSILDTEPRVYGCGCKAYNSHLDYCPTHAHAPAMLDGLRAFVALHASDATEHGYETCDCDPCIQARAILRALEG